MIVAQRHRLVAATRISGRRVFCPGGGKYDGRKSKKREQEEKEGEEEEEEGEEEKLEELDRHIRRQIRRLRTG